MTPGPVPLPEWVLKEIAEPVLHHRTVEFEAILARVLSRLKTVFMTKQPCFILTASGTGGMEAALVNTVQRGDTVISIDSGKFGQRWHEMAQVLGYKSISLSFNWGESIDLQKVADTLKKYPEAKAIFCQACETSSGAMLPVRALAQITKGTDTLLIVDAITALGAYELAMDDWGLDVVIGGSQKALMLPTGLAVMSLSQKAWSRVKNYAPSQAFYWNLLEEHKANEKTQTRFSSAVTLIRGLDVVLAHIEKIGVAELFETHARRARLFRERVLKNGVTLFPKDPSPSLTCLKLPDGIDSTKIQENLQSQHRIVVMGGQDQLKGKVLRVGHMGWMTDEDLTVTADAIHSVLAAGARV
jgi:aspartate aminotransferase-like enzyme